jgi:hypothetical protein
MQEERTGRRRVVKVASAPTVGRGYVRRVWDHWKQSAHAIGVVQTRFIMLSSTPSSWCRPDAHAAVARPLHLKAPERDNWTPTRPHERNVDAAPAVLSARRPARAAVRGAAARAPVGLRRHRRSANAGKSRPC